MKQLLVGLLVLSAGQGALGVDEPAPWETWQPPAVELAAPNGFDLCLKAFALKKQIDQQHGPVYRVVPKGVAEAPSNLPLDQRVALYDPVLKLVREALPLAIDCRIPPPRSADASWPYLPQFREVARLLVMEEQVRLEAGDIPGAANSALDCMEMAQAPATHRTHIGLLVAGACEAIGTKALDEVILRLDAQGCKHALARMARIEQRRVPMAEVLDGEERVTRLAFQRIMANPKALDEYLPKTLDEYLRGTVLNPAERKTYLETMRTTTWGAIGQCFAGLQAQAARPYRQRQALPVPTDPFLKHIPPTFERLGFREAATQASFRLRQAQIAACWFLREKGHVPQNLDELVSAYLPAVPADPFGEGPLKSKVTPAALVIYSLGPDGTDDGGTPIEGFPLMGEGSLGDIVVTVPKV